MQKKLNNCFLCGIELISSVVVCGNCNNLFSKDFRKAQIPKHIPRSQLSSWKILAYKKEYERMKQTNLQRKEE